MHKMLAPLLLLAALILPSAQQTTPLTKTVDQKFSTLANWLEQWKELSSSREIATGQALGRIATAGIEVRKQLEQLQVDLTDLIQIVQVSQANVTRDLEILRGRQAVGGAVQGGQVFMFVAYLVTIAVLCLVKHCNKHRERLAQSEFELLEAKLQSNKAKRRAAAARAKSAQEGLPRPART